MNGLRHLLLLLVVRSIDSKEAFVWSQLKITINSIYLVTKCENRVVGATIVAVLKLNIKLLLPYSLRIR